MQRLFAAYGIRIRLDDPSKADAKNVADALVKHYKFIDVESLTFIQIKIQHRTYTA